VTTVFGKARGILATRLRKASCAYLEVDIDLLENGHRRLEVFPPRDDRSLDDRGSFGFLPLRRRPSVVRCKRLLPVILVRQFIQEVVAAVRAGQHFVFE
jgi:hypothetical protein